MGLDQHRAQVTADWLDTASGEVSRARVAPADRAGVRRFLARFGGGGLEGAVGGATGRGVGRAGGGGGGAGGGGFRGREPAASRGDGASGRAGRARRTTREQEARQ